jgi:hypothetical protein
MIHFWYLKYKNNESDKQIFSIENKYVFFLLLNFENLKLNLIKLV